MKKIIIFIICLFSVFQLSGCRQNNGVTDTSDNNRSQYMNVKNSSINEVRKEDSEEISNHLANLAADVPNVNNATAVALGKFAVVGIDVDKDLDRSKVGSIKYSVAEALKKDPYGANAVVVADPDFFARIDEIRNDIQDGKPVQGVLNELSDIVGRLMPEVPGDLQDPSIENRTEEPKQETDGQKDAKKLNNQQNKQSNHYKDNNQ